MDSEIGQIFNAWSEVEYTGYKSMSKDTDWCSLIRQKINNLYTRYFDDEVILNKEYMDALRTPKRLYYRWINGEEMQCDELIDIIDKSINNSKELKVIYQKQKMKLSWNEYKIVIEEFLQKIFNNCKPIEDYEVENKLLNIYDMSSEDNSYVSCFCKSLEGCMLDYQKKKYNIKRGRNKKYIRCAECGKLIEKTNNRIKYCSDCAPNVDRKKATNRMKIIRGNKCSI